MNINLSDLGAKTKEAKNIAQKSRKKAIEIVGDEKLNDKIVQRCVIATGDPSISSLLKFKLNPIEEGIKALNKKQPIFTDINMVKAGITSRSHESKIKSVIGEGDKLATEEGLTRTSSGLLTLKDELNDSIIVIGNAPSALSSLCEMLEKELINPSLIIGVPVGFVGAKQSKERLYKTDFPSITIEGTRGGTPIAVAAMNEIINIRKRRKDE
ncbi:MAG: Precorrin isomerase CobH [Candidatus Methanohalarchaeum thermophilum]|uniref:Precorrin isomerase CobH n=1 Tax=Methanohalarchaeum thermophilum TaxID=1903181 RepID=A0A1Q6DVG6_METT1|nr:MAG: Precorrin isomerase CobH [Candidatus Methanohalarchaeum thermophilum]